jgi:hypothetical protein
MWVSISFEGGWLVGCPPVVSVEAFDVVHKVEDDNDARRAHSARATAPRGLGGDCISC